MEKKEGFGFIKLAKKTLAVITTSLSTLMIDESKALPTTSKIHEVSKSVNYESFPGNIKKPQLILQLNQSNPNLATSHGSHRSHSSHSSHASHYSSSPSSSYTPPIKTDTIPQSTYKPSVISNNNSAKSDTTSAPNKMTYHMLGSRTLQQAYEGTDVQQLQQGLIQLGYKTPSDGFYGATTELAVMKFQVANNLRADGIVDSLTLKKLQSLLK
jgi:His-Xaa-Ser repeat protein HxsA